MTKKSKKPVSVDVGLETPVPHNGTEITNLTFRRLKAGDLLVAEDEANPVKAGYLIYAAMAGVDVEVINELDIDDFETVTEKVAPLMGKSAAKLIQAKADAKTDE